MQIINAYDIIFIIDFSQSGRLYRPHAKRIKTTKAYYVSIFLVCCFKRILIVDLKKKISVLNHGLIN